MNDTLLPSDLQSVIGTEKIDFSVSAKRNQPIKKSLQSVLFGLFILAFMSIFVIAFLGPIFKGEESHFKVNGVPTTASWENFQPMLVPTLIIGVIVLCGLGLLLFGIYSLFQKGGIFVGTNNRLIKFHKGNINSYDWEQFSGNMEINSLKGDLTLQLRTGKMVSRKDKSDEFVPDIIHISGVPEVLEIEKICRNKIKENDPTPANQQNLTREQ
jgi:hypothetical protein